VLSSESEGNEGSVRRYIIAKVLHRRSGAANSLRKVAQGELSAQAVL